MRRPFSAGLIRVERESERKNLIGYVPAPPGPAENHGVVEALRAETKTTVVADRLRTLRGLLAAGLAADAERERASAPAAPTAEDLPAELRAGPPPDHADFELTRPHLLSALLPGIGVGHPAPNSAAERAYHQAVATWEEARAREDDAVADLKRQARERSEGLERTASAAVAGDAAAIRSVVEARLAAAPLPFDHPMAPSVEVDTAARALSVDLRGPAMAEVAPAAARYRYAKKRKAIVAVPFAEDQRETLYRQVVAQVALLALHHAFSAAPATAVDRVTLVVHAEGIDPATGRPARVELVRLTTDRAAFGALDLARVDPVACVERLTGHGPARVPLRQPAESAA